MFKIFFILCFSSTKLINGSLDDVKGEKNNMSRSSNNLSYVFLSVGFLYLLSSKEWIWIPPFSCKILLQTPTLLTYCNVRRLHCQHNIFQFLCPILWSGAFIHYDRPSPEEIHLPCLAWSTVFLSYSLPSSSIPLGNRKDFSYAMSQVWELIFEGGHIIDIRLILLLQKTHSLVIKSLNHPKTSITQGNHHCHYTILPHTSGSFISISRGV